MVEVRKERTVELALGAVLSEEEARLCSSMTQLDLDWVQRRNRLLWIVMAAEESIEVAPEIDEVQPSEMVVAEE